MIKSPLIAGVMTWGVWGKNLNTSEMVQRINAFVSEGIITFDHADIYGGYTTEESFGKALAESGILRENIQLISKCGIQHVCDTRNNRINEVSIFSLNFTQTKMTARKTSTTTTCRLVLARGMMVGTRQRRGGGDGHRFCGDTHNNQTDHGEGGQNESDGRHNKAAQRRRRAAQQRQRRRRQAAARRRQGAAGRLAVQ
mgnify:CR=1 FL=1